jgi:hypothetical protein
MGTSIRGENSMLNWIIDRYDAFMIDVWPFVRWIVYAYVAVFVLVFLASGGMKGVIANAHRLSCHVNELAFGTASAWQSVDCEAWFRIH